MAAVTCVKLPVYLFLCSVCCYWLLFSRGRPTRQLYFQCDDTLSAARGQIWPLNSSATQAMHYNK